MITVVRAGPLTTVQDRGRPGYAHLGVPHSGALDPPAARLANALAGNDESAAVLETTLMGCGLRFTVPARVAVTGAVAEVRVDGAVVPPGVQGAGAGLGGGSYVAAVIEVPVGAVLDVGRAAGGVRSYVAVAGGIDVPPVLGSRSTDTLSGLGPGRLRDGMTLPVGVVRLGERSRSAYAYAPAPGPESAAGPFARAAAGGGVLELDVLPGPRDDWVADRQVLFGDSYQISPVSNRIGARLAGPALTRARPGELPPEGIVLGAIQVPPDGQPLIFLADHPTTGGYPVIGVVDDVTPLAQARPGTTVRFRELHRPQRGSG